MLRAAALLLALPAGAHETALGLASPFRTPPRIVVPAQARPGDELWRSEELAAEFGFGAVLLHGQAGQPGVRFELRGSGPAAATAWKAADLETFPNGRFWAKTALAGRRGDRIQLRVVHEGIGAGSVIEIFEIELVPRGPRERGGARAGGELPSMSRPGVIDRDAWGAAPPTQPYLPIAPWRLTVHHTAGARPLTLEDALTEVRLIQRYHQNGRGWIDVGYHYLIDGAGRVFAGRPENAQGAHARGHNDGNLGISLMGSFHPPRSQQPTAEQLAALETLARALAADYRVAPASLKGHRDYNPTDCPGDGVYPHLDTIRGGLPPVEEQPMTRLMPPRHRKAPPGGALRLPTGFFD